MPGHVEVHVLPTGETPRTRFNDFTHSVTLMDVAYGASSAYLDGRLGAGSFPPVASGPQRSAR
jgi:hypothetical protein